MLSGMEENAPEAPDVPQNAMWMIDFHLSFEPDALAASYINCDVAYRPKADNRSDWKIDGIASFEAPTLIPPRAGADLLPYLLYHLDEIKAWLMEEHVRRVFNGTPDTISTSITDGTPPPDLHLV